MAELSAATTAGRVLVDLVIGAELPAPSAVAEMSGLPAALGLAGVGLLILLVNGFDEETGSVALVAVWHAGFNLVSAAVTGQVSAPQDRVRIPYDA